MLIGLYRADSFKVAVIYFPFINGPTTPCGAPESPDELWSYMPLYDPIYTLSHPRYLHMSFTPHVHHAHA